jgi:hypothetical protein
MYTYAQRAKEIGAGGIQACKIIKNIITIYMNISIYFIKYVYAIIEFY